MDKVYRLTKRIPYVTMSYVSDERIKKDMIHRLIEDMPIESLEKIFKIDVLNPLSIESARILCDPSVSEYEKDRILSNRETDTLEYTSSVCIFDNLK